MGYFFHVPVNYLAVLICGIASMVLGFLWYGPLFGKVWMSLVGLTPQKIAKEKSSMPQTYFLMFIASLVTAYVLFHFIWYATRANYTLFISIKTALWGWIGLVFPISLTKFLFSPDKKPAKLLFIETGYHLVALVVMATIFYFFK
jgi:RsiW-degrading membrane proteinase PrsW (M82 family)